MTSISFFTMKFLSSLILPPAGPILLALVFIVLAVKSENPRRRRVHGAVAVFFLLILFVLSLPIVGNALLASLDRYPPISEAQLKQAQAIVVLSGGVYRGAPEYGGDTVDRSSLERLRYGARLARLSKLPVLVTGGAPYGGRPEADLMRIALEQEFGVRVSWLEAEARNTFENASLSALLLKASGVSRIALVSHSWHLPRAIPLFEREGLVVIPAPTGFTTVPGSLFRALLPDDGAASHEALREYLGLLFNYLVGAR